MTRPASRLSLALPAALLALLTGCGVGLDNAVSREHTSIQGVNGQVGAIDLLDFYLAPATGAPGSPGAPGGLPSPSGSAAPTPTSTASAGITGRPVAAPAPAGSGRSAGPASASPSAGPQGYLAGVLVNNGSGPETFTGATLSGGGTVTPSGPGMTAGGFSIPPGASLRFADPTVGLSGPLLLVTGLATSPTPGITVSVTFDFAVAGSVQLAVPVLPDAGTTATAAPVPSTSVTSP